MEVALPVSNAVQVAWWVWACVGAYGLAGFVFAIAFVLRGAARVDHAAESSPWSFRIVILPGAVALWPLLLVKWIRARKSTGAHG